MNFHDGDFDLAHASSSVKSVCCLLFDIDVIVGREVVRLRPVSFGRLYHLEWWTK
jgi:hypothetical protein